MIFRTATGFSSNFIVTSAITGTSPGSKIRWVARRKGCCGRRGVYLEGFFIRPQTVWIIYKIPSVVLSGIEPLKLRFRKPSSISINVSGAENGSVRKCAGMRNMASVKIVLRLLKKNVLPLVPKGRKASCFVRDGGALFWQHQMMFKMPFRQPVRIATHRRPAPGFAQSVGNRYNNAEPVPAAIINWNELRNTAPNAARGFQGGMPDCDRNDEDQNQILLEVPAAGFDQLEKVLRESGQVILPEEIVFSQPLADTLSPNWDQVVELRLTPGCRQKCESRS